VPPVINAVLRMIFYLTPFLYPAEVVPENYRAFYLLNPIAVIAEMYRGIVLYHTLPDIADVIYALLVAISVFVVGFTLFKSNKNLMVDYL
jgi:ABC-type polysaccharide/polyol phosphate export permease